MLPVSNWDSTNEVIRLALQQFGIIVSKEEQKCIVFDGCQLPG